MVRRICPICDQVMRGSHYCKNCRSWVKHPYVRDITYYLNERHPVGETGCSYHAGPDLASREESRVGSRQTGAGRQPAGQQQPQGSERSGSWQPQSGQYRSGQAGKTVPSAGVSSSSRPSDSGRPFDSSRSSDSVRTSASSCPRFPERVKRGKNTGFLVVILVMIVIKLIGSCASAGIRAFNTIMPETIQAEYDVDLGGFAGEDETWSADYIELDEEEVAAAGVECSRENHFSVSGADLGEPLTDLLQDYGLEVTNVNTYSFNEKYDDGATWYVTWTVYDLNDGMNGGYQYAELDYDTATEGLHQIDLSIEDPQELAEITADALELLKDRGALLEGEDCADVIRTEMGETLERDGSYSIQSQDLYIDGYFEGEYYTASIYRIRR